MQHLVGPNNNFNRNPMNRLVDDVVLIVSDNLLVSSPSK